MTQTAGRKRNGLDGRQEFVTDNLRPANEHSNIAMEIPP